MGERERGNSYEHVLHLHFILLLFTIITDEEINPDLGWQEAGKVHNIGRTQRASPVWEMPGTEKELTSGLLFLMPGTLFWLREDECSHEARKCQEPEQSRSSGHPNSAFWGFFDRKGTLAICPVSRDDWAWLQCPWRDVNACRQTIQVEIMFASINHFYNFS